MTLPRKALLAVDELTLLERYLTDIRQDVRGLRADMQLFMSNANAVDASQGIQIADLQARLSSAEKDIMEGSSDRSRLWERVWQFGLTGAVIANIVLGGGWESVTR
jgi:uncharacterized protein YigA (DUF484 family)